MTAPAEPKAIALAPAPSLASPLAARVCPPDDPAITRPKLLEAFHAHVVSGDDDRLYEAVCAFVRSMVHAGAPPERVLVEVKHAYAEATVCAAPDPYRSSTVLARVVAWCITEYFRPATA